MDSGETPAQRPFTLDITVEDVNREPLAPASPEPASSQVPSRENLFAQEDNIDLDAGFATPREDSSATPSESLMERLNDQMMESVMISDSPINSEEDDVAPIDSLLETGEESKNAGELSGDQEEQPETEQQSTTEIQVAAEEQKKEGAEKEVEDDTEEQKDIIDVQVDTQSPSNLINEEPEPQAATGTRPKAEPVPVCTIFSQPTQAKVLVPDGFQPTLIKSPSFSMASGAVSDEAATPGKQGTPLVCQPSPSLSKFFSDNGQVNPASDFFDSFTAPSSFISVSNPNAGIPPGHGSAPAALTPERQLSSTSSSLSTPGGPVDSAAAEAIAKAQPSPPPGVPALNQAPAPPSSTQPQPFNKLQAVFTDSDDPFATALSLSEVDRRYNAWLPSEETRKVLIAVATQQCSPSQVEANRLTMPGLKFDNLQVNIG